MKKVQIHEFSSEIYPLLLWVCLNAEDEALKDVYDFVPNNDGIKESIEKNSASVSIVIRKSDKRRGALVFTEKKSLMEAHIIAHEAVHVADVFFQELSMTSQAFDGGNEPYAYLVGWAVKCINSAIKHKK